MPKGSRPGERRGGRGKGALNKRTIWHENAVKCMKEEGVNPIQILAQAAGGSQDITMLQVKAAIELAKYGWAQKTRVEISGFDGAPITVASLRLETLTVGELQELYRLRKKIEPATIEATAEEIE